MNTNMTSSDLVDLISSIEEAGISAWLDGGWGVDALLQSQTRKHKDVDMVVRVADVPKLQEVLASRAFSILNGTPPTSFVLLA